MKVALAFVKTLVLVTLTLVRSYPSLSQKITLHLFRSHPNTNLDHPFSIEWDRPLLFLSGHPRILRPSSFILFNHLRAFEGPQVPFFGPFTLVDCPLLSVWTVHANPGVLQFWCF